MAVREAQVNGGEWRRDLARTVGRRERQRAVIGEGALQSAPWYGTAGSVQWSGRQVVVARGRETRVRVKGERCERVRVRCVCVWRARVCMCREGRKAGSLDTLNSTRFRF